MGLGKLGEQLGGMWLVNGIPESLAAFECSRQVFRCRSTLGGCAEAGDDVRIETGSESAECVDCLQGGFQTDQLAIPAACSPWECLRIRCT